MRVAPDGTSANVAQDLAFPNGMVITPDSKTLIVAESIGRKLTAFTIGADGRCPIAGSSPMDSKVRPTASHSTPKAESGRR